MTRQKPDPRITLERSSDNDKRRLREPAPPDTWLRDFADRASFEPYSKHKLNPRAFGLAPFTGQRVDATYCDGHAGFAPADMHRIPELLHRGILAGLVGDNDQQDDPTLIWTVDDSGWIYEGRLTIPGRSVYHGYPVLRTEAIARIVIPRYIQWVYDKDGALFKSAQRVQERYS